MATKLRITQTAFSKTTDLTIASGVVTIDTTKAHVYKIAAESGTGDDLVTINGGVLNDVITLRADTGDTLSVRTSGNITSPRDEVVLDDDTSISFHYDGSGWRILGGNLGVTDAINLRAAGSTKTIASGAIEVTSSYSHYEVAAETGTEDDLATITAGTGIAAGDIITLFADAGDKITLTTAGNIERALVFTEDHAVILRYDGSQWQQIGSSGCGWKPVYIPITAFRPSDSGGCAAVSELDNNAVRAFDEATDEQALVNLDFPPGWSGKLKGAVKWIVGDTDSGNVIWALKTENAATGEVMGNAATTTLTANAAGGTLHEFSGTAISAEHTAGADGENILLYLIRDADNASDTYGSDAYAVGVMLYYLMYEDGIS